MTKDRKPPIDDDAPLLDDAFFSRARPGGEVLSASAIAGFRGKGGRPKAEAPKKLTSLRLDPRILDAARRSGDGWQTRINDALLSLIVVDPETRQEVLKAPRSSRRKNAA